MPQTRTRREPGESSFGFFRQVLSTSNTDRKLPHYPMRPEFQGISYAQRYSIFCERLVRERLYDATCFLMSSQEGGLRGEYSEPNAELSFRNFATSLYARAAAFVKVRE